MQGSAHLFLECLSSQQQNFLSLFYCPFTRALNNPQLQFILCSLKADFLSSWSALILKFPHMKVNQTILWNETGQKVCFQYILHWKHCKEMTIRWKAGKWEGNKTTLNGMSKAFERKSPKSPFCSENRNETKFLLNWICALAVTKWNITKS